MLYKEPDINWWLKYKRLPNRHLIIPPTPCCFWRNVANPVKAAKHYPFQEVHFLSPQWISEVIKHMQKSVDADDFLNRDSVEVNVHEKRD